MKKNEILRKISTVTMAAALMAGSFAGLAMAAAPGVDDEPDLVVEEIEKIEKVEAPAETVVKEESAPAPAAKNDTATSQDTVVKADQDAPAAKADDTGATSEEVAASGMNISADVEIGEPEVGKEDNSSEQQEGAVPAEDADKEQQEQPVAEAGTGDGSVAESGNEDIPAADQEAVKEPEKEAEKPAEAPVNPQPAAPETQETEEYDTPLGDKAFEYEYEKDEDGVLVLDENDDPIAILKEGQDIPVSWIRRANGELVLDKNGNPIATQVVPAKAVHIETLQDRLNADRAIDIYVTFEKDGTTVGESATLTAVLNGYDALVYTLQWQQSDDGKEWKDIDAATGNELEIITSEDNRDDYWRVQVTITGLAR